MIAQDDMQTRRARQEGAEAWQQADVTGERSAQSHDHSADHFEEHAALLERFGAHRFASTDRHHAAVEREAAEAARRN
jgi:hypothetical protein